MDSLFKNLYDRLPAGIQNAALTGFSLVLDRERYGRGFEASRKFLNESQWYDTDRLHDYQCRQLRSLIDYAYAKVPYYTRIMNEHAIRPADIQTPADLARFPVLTKYDIRAHFNDLLSRDFDVKSVRKGHTSGTTGTPLEVCYDRPVVHMTYAMLDRQYVWAGAELRRFGDRIAVLRGNVIVPLTRKGPPYWRYNHLHRQLLLSSFHLSPDNLPYYVAELERFRPKVLDGYPSTLYILARYLKNTGKTFKVDAVISASETLYDFQREAIEDSFQCRVFDYFTAAERVIFATECDRHSGHHIAEEYGITELLDEDNRPVPVGSSGKIVATSLHNRAMPLIRYVTNDMTALRPTHCSCGRALPLMEDVATKAEDVITLKDGRLISPSVLTHPFKPLTSIQASQIIQESLDSVRVKIVPGETFTEHDRAVLVSGLQERIGTDVELNVEIVPDIERSRNGKFRWVISHVKLGI